MCVFLCTLMRIGRKCRDTTSCTFENGSVRLTDFVDTGGQVLELLGAVDHQLIAVLVHYLVLDCLHDVATASRRRIASSLLLRLLLLMFTFVIATLLLLMMMWLFIRFFLFLFASHTSSLFFIFRATRQ